MNKAFGLSGVWSTLLLAGTAHAQVVPSEQPPAGTSVNGTTPSDTPDAADIIVTAQRRTQRLVDVPVAVTVISGDTIAKAGVTGLLDLTKVAPGVVLDKNGAYLQPTIRGIGTNLAGPGADPNVAIYVDGVYQSSQTGNFFELSNVADVEILKGPQGTLFGRNATGGAILVKLLDPAFDPSGRADLSYGRYNETRASTYLTTGLTDTLAADLSVYYRRSDGWIHDLRTGDDRNAQHSFDIRSKLLFKPTDSLKFILAAGYDETSDPTGLAAAAANGNSSGRPLPDSGPIASERGDLSHDLPPRIAVRSTNVSLHADLDTGIGTLASITSYKFEKSHINGDLEGSYAIVQDAVYDQVFRDLTQEVNLTSAPGGRFSYVLGAFYFHERSGDPFFAFNGNTLYHNQLITDAISGYADGTFKIGQLSLIGGLRYSSERKRYQFGAGAGNVFTLDTNRTFGNFTPRVGLSLAVTPKSNLYATYSKGFKSGTYNLGSGSPVPVEPEKVDAFEIGYKQQSQLLSLNLSAFYYKYKNIQVTAFDYNVGINRLLNAAAAEIYGADAELTLRLSSRFDLRSAIAYTHSRFSSFPGAIVFVPKPGNTGNATVVTDESGNPLIRAPEFTASASATYRVPVGRDAVELSLTPYYSSRVYYTFDRRISQPGYFTLDGQLAYDLKRDLRLSIYGRNLTDKVYATYRSASSARDGVVYASPRTYGVAATYRF